MSRDELKQRIDTVEAAYEFMLSYAARGMSSDGNSPLRSHLEGAAAALAGLGDAIRGAIEEAAPGDDSSADAGGATAPFVAVVESDAAASLAALNMVLARAEISSQLVDNLNASIHLRALLTDLFLIDEALGLGVGDTSPPAVYAPDEDEPFGPDGS